jgi:BioD-like phosphotransacetylase family protein
MAKKIFIAATGQNCGKTTTCIGLMHLALKKYGRVGFIKPLGPKPAVFHGCTVDKDAALKRILISISRMGSSEQEECFQHKHTDYFSKIKARFIAEMMPELNYR